MSCRVEMFGRVPILRAVAAADVPTVQAHPKVNPGITGLQALFAALRVWGDVANRIEARTLLRHGVLRARGFELYGNTSVHNHCMCAGACGNVALWSISWLSQIMAPSSAAIR